MTQITDIAITLNRMSYNIQIVYVGWHSELDCGKEVQICINLLKFKMADDFDPNNGHGHNF